MSAVRRVAAAFAGSPLLSDHGLELCSAVAELTEPVFGEIESIERVEGGNVSHVFRFRRSDGATAILKARGRTFARIPELKVDPARLFAEVRALETMTMILPGMFPLILNVDVSHSLLLMDDVFPCRNFANALATRPPTPDEARTWGSALREVHCRGRAIGEDIQPGGDKQYGQRMRSVALRRLSDRGRRIAEERLDDGTATLLLGDGSPKNMGFCGSRLRFCDLESVHHGHHIFDLSYALAHLILHSIDVPDLSGAVAALIGAYGEDLDGDEGAATIVLGILLYRLSPGNVPYTLRYDHGTLDRVGSRVEGMAARPGVDIWSIAEGVEQLC